MIGRSPASLGNSAVGCEVICANSGFAIAARKITAKSCGVVHPGPPGPSSPEGDVALVLVAPMATALAFILPTATSNPPSMSARVLAASLPDTSRRPSSNWRTE